MLYLIGSIIFAAGAGSSLAQGQWQHVSLFCMFCVVFLAAGCYSISKED